MSRLLCMRSQVKCSVRYPFYQPPHSRAISPFPLSYVSLNPSISSPSKGRKMKGKGRKGAQRRIGNMIQLVVLPSFSCPFNSSFLVGSYFSQVSCHIPISLYGMHTVSRITFLIRFNKLPIIT